MRNAIILYGVFLLCMFGKQELSANQTNECTDRVVFNDTEYSIGKKSLGIDKDFLRAGIERDKIEYSLEVKKGTDLIQIIPYDDYDASIDTISISDELGGNCLKVEFEGNWFRTSPVGYSGVEFYRILSDGTLILYFRYYKEIGQQDMPKADILNIKKESNQIILTYTYFHSVGFPNMGYGNFQIVYVIEAGIIQYSDLSSNIIATEYPQRDLPTSEHKIDLSRDGLNTAFEYLTAPRKFVY